MTENDTNTVEFEEVTDTEDPESEVEGETQTVIDRVRDRWPSNPSMTDDHESAAANIADEIREAFANVILGIGLAVMRVVPFSENFWRGLFKAGLKGIHKKSGCDYVGFIQVGGSIKPVPVNWDYDSNRFENRHDDWWKAPSEGEYRYRMAGNVPVIWASSTSNHVGSHIQAEVAEALDIGHDMDLYKEARVSAQKAVLKGSEQQTANALADGGAINDASAIADFRFSNKESYGFEDRIVGLTNDDEYDARAVSLDKYYQVYPEVVDTEEMKMQEQRGELAMTDRDYGKMALKMLLVAGGIIAVVELGPPLINVLFGGAGGGGGGAGDSFLPIFIDTAASTLGALI
jgi:hypothetical protein